MGIPTILVSSADGFTRNPIPSSVPKDLWSVVYNKADMLSKLEYFALMSSRRREVLRNWAVAERQFYFNSSSKESIYRLLGVKEF